MEKQSPKAASQLSLVTNNPFTIGLEGLKLLFALAQPVAIVGIVLSALSFLGNFTPRPSSIPADSLEPVSTTYTLDPVVWVILAMAIATFVLIAIFIAGIFDYTAANIAKGKTVTLGQAIRGVGQRFAGYLWVQIIVAVKTLLWTLLLIVPGMIMSVRYSLSGTIFFAEDKRGNAAVKESIAITKGAWLTTYAGFALWNLMTFGVMSAVLDAGIKAKLYQLLGGTAGQPKAPAHVLSWIALFFPIGLLLIGLSLIVLVFGILFIALPSA